MSKTPKKSRALRVRKETILKTLIVLGIIGILVSAYIQYGVPYLHERQLEKLDARRVSDLTTLNTEIANILKTNPQANLGAPDTVYVSVPSAQSDCSDLDLPTLAPNWSYHCVATSTLQNADGTGWLPIDFNKHSSTTVSTIPVDPTNNPSLLDYYAFVMDDTGTSTEYALTTGFDSKKYVSEKAETDNGTDPIRYELGNNLTLWASARGLIGYWTFGDSGSVALDHSGNGNDLTLPKSDLYTSSGCESGACIYNRYSYPLTINFPEILPISKMSSVSYGFWFEIPNVPQTNVTLFNPATNRLDINIEGPTGALFVWFTSPTIQEQVYKSADAQFTDGKWHQIFVVKDSDSISVYIDGLPVEDLSTIGDTQNDLSQGVISILPGEKMESLVFYNRTLSIQEIANSF